jgi:hypothetical protein
MPRSLEETRTGVLYEAVNPMQSDSLAKLKVEQSQRLQQLKTCLTRAAASDSSGSAYLAGLDCFEQYLWCR